MFDLNYTKVFQRPLDNIKIIILYRIFSTVITSIFYLTIDDNHSMLTNSFVVICIVLSAIIIVHLYVKYIHNKDFIKMVIIVETLGITLILIPTGGINSPYIWYALNTILISAYWLPIYYTILILSLYLILTITLFNWLYNDILFLSFVLDNSNLILSFILITAILLLLARLNNRLNNKSKELEELNQELTQLNKKSNESIEYIISLYQAIHSLSNYHCKKRTIQLLIKYIKKISNTSYVIYYNLDSEDYLDYGDEKLEEAQLINLKTAIKRDINEIKESATPTKLYLDREEYMFIPVKSMYKTYGILGIKNNIHESDLYYRENIKQMKFLSDLSSLIIERVYLEEINESLLIDQEQNRIANEIHDSVCQRLFATSCAAHSLQQKYDKISKIELYDILSEIKNSLSIAMKELRISIYKLSRDKQQKNTFVESIKDYVEDLSKLHNVEIILDMNANNELIPIEYKKAIYRIVCEGTGNAIRHGKANIVNILLCTEDDSICLKITDNGIGFNQKKDTIKSNNGLGIKNIYNLVHSLNGNINIYSKVGKGTIIDIIFKRENKSLTV